MPTYLTNFIEKSSLLIIPIQPLKKYFLSEIYNIQLNLSNNCLTCHLILKIYRNNYARNRLNFCLYHTTITIFNLRKWTNVELLILFLIQSNHSTVTRPNSIIMSAQQPFIATQKPEAQKTFLLYLDECDPVTSAVSRFPNFSISTYVS